MKNYRNLCLAVVLSTICSSCDPFLEPDNGMVDFHLANNSNDTICCSVYLHHINSPSNVVRYWLDFYPIYPSGTKTMGGVFAEGAEDTWESFFKTLKIDTLYISNYVVPEADNKLCDLPAETDFLKVYKFYEGNFDMSKQYFEIEYP